MLAQAAPPQHPRCLIFDLFGVLLSFDDTLVYERLAAHCTAPEQAWRTMADLVSRPDLICGRLSLEALHAELVDRLGLRLSPQAFSAVWKQPYSTPMPGMQALLRQIDRGCRLVLLSNVDPYYWPTALQSLPELGRFDALVLSFESGHAKPDRQAFERAVAVSGHPVDACFFLDDKMENIHAAAGIGLRGQVFTCSAALEPVLRSFGVLGHRHDG